MTTQKQKPSGSFISYFSNLVKQHGGINLAQGIPGFPPPEELTAILARLASDNVHQYAPGIGNFMLRDVLLNSLSLQPKNLLIVQGATEGLSLVYTYLLRLLGGDFSVLSFEPAYESYSNLPRIFGQRFFALPLSENGEVDFSLFTRKVKEESVKLVFLSSPGNPYGKIFSRAAVEQLLALADELDFYLVFDSVYRDLYFESKPYEPYDKLTRRLFIVGSFSKSLSISGWRIGYVVNHECHTDGIRSVHDYIGLCVPSVLQQALAQYLRDYRMGERYVESLRRDVIASFTSLSEVLIDSGFFIPPIQGGCFIWALLPERFSDGFAFASELYRKHRVAVIPGEHFSADARRWLRINVARPRNEILAAGRAIAEFVQSRL